MSLFEMIFLVCGVGAILFFPVVIVVMAIVGKIFE